MGRWAAAIGLVVPVGVAIAPSSARADVTYLRGCGGEGLQREPVEVLLSCADAKLRVEGLEWSRWEADDALATGTLTYPDCAPRVPLVACQDYAHRPVTFKLWQPAYCPTFGSRLFIRALVIDESATTPATRNSPFRFPCPERSTPKFFLRTSRAASLMRNALGRRPAFSFSAARARRVRCNHRVARDRIKCQMSWFVGDLVFWGHGVIWITYPEHRPFWNFSYRVTRFNEYCAVVGGADCTKTYVER